MIKEIEGGVTAAKGFLATGIAAGIKKDGSMMPTGDGFSVHSAMPALILTRRKSM